MRNFEERKMEIFKRSKEFKIEQIKRQRKIITVCVALVLCVSIASTILIPRLNVFNTNTSSGQDVSGDKPSSQNTSSGRVTSGGNSNGVDVENEFIEGASSNVINLMAEVRPNKVTPLNSLDSQNVKMTDFAVRFFKACQEDGKNTLVSPLSVISALAMTANGAKGDTLSQMEKVFGMTRDELNLYLYTYINSLPQDEKYSLNLANSIWFTDDKRFTVNQSFLQTNGDFYGADIYKAPFDNDTLDSINNWVNKNTDGMIPQILDKIPEEAVMYLINALAFEAQWDVEFGKNQILYNKKFTKEDGTEQKATFMECDLTSYLEDDKARGFIKYYKDKKYAFVALLPNEGITVSQYLKSLNGNTVSNLLSNVKNTTVTAIMPKFETEYSIDFTGKLKDMGMPLAVDEGLANFKGIGTYKNANLYIGSAIHKTFISVTEKGTKAGAATSIGIFNDTAELPSPPKVELDRPFVYMLIDCENNVPFFIGTMMDVNA